MPRTTTAESRRRARVDRPEYPPPRLPQVPPGRLSRRTRFGPDRPRSRSRCPDAADPARRPGPGLRATIQDRPFAGIAGDKLRAWFEKGGIPRSEFYARIHFAAVTRCYPGRLPGARGDRLPSPEEQALCRPWLDELIDILEPEIVLLVGSLAIRTFLGPFRSLSDVVGTATIRDGVRYLPCPIPPASADGSTSRPTSRPSIGR